MLNLTNFWKEKGAIIADDLTGANEIAGIIVKNGKKCLVLNNPLDNSKIKKLWNIYDELVFNLDSRNLTEQRAYAKIKDFLTSSEEIKKRLIYKKIDSTLRGNVGKEIDAVLDTGCADIAVLVPALPKMGRVTVGGYHLIEQVPVSRSFYAGGFTQSYLPELLRGQTECQVGYVSLQIVESGPESLSQQLIREHKRGSSIIFCDCCNRDDLKNIKQAVFGLKLKVLPVGTAGLFEELFHKDEPRSSPCLIVCGSLNQKTRSQLVKLIDEERTGYLELDLLSILSRDQQDEFRHSLLEGEAILNQGKNLVIATPRKCWGIKIKERKKMDMVKSQIDQCLAHLTKHFIERYPLAGVIVTGGDTAKALLDSLQAQGIEVVDELEFLVPVGVVKGGRWEGMTIITKTGGFGGEDVFLKAVNYLRGNKG